MGMLENVTKGKIKKPHIILIYGVDGCGKSTFGSQAPNPIFLGSEDGSNQLEVARFPAPKSWGEIEKCVDALLKEKHDYKTLVIDSADWIEPILHNDICARYNVKSIELAAGGYGKGYGESLVEWQKHCRNLARLRDEKGMHIIIIAHSEVVKFTDPSTQTEYDRYGLKLYKKSSALLREFADCVLFANFEIFTKKEGQKNLHFGNGDRVIYTERRPGFDAKNRFGLPFQLPLSWQDFENAISPESKETLLSAIEGMMGLLKDETIKDKVFQAVKKTDGNIEQLRAIRNRLIEVTNE